MRKTPIILVLAVVAIVAVSACCWLLLSNHATALNFRAERGNATAQWELARILETEETDESTIEAYHWYAAASANGISAASGDIERLVQDPRWTKVLAEVGDANAQFLHYQRLTSDGHPKAMDWLKRSAGNHNREAMYLLALNLLAEKETAQDAVKMLRSAAELDHPEAAFQMGKLYEEGIHIRTDLNASGLWYNKAAMLEHPQASLIIGKRFLDHARGPADLTQARTYLSTAYHAGLMEAAHGMGKLHVTHREIPEALVFLMTAYVALKSDRVYRDLLPILQKPVNDSPYDLDLHLGWELYRQRWIKQQDITYSPFAKRVNRYEIQQHRAKLVADALRELTEDWNQNRTDLEQAIREFLPNIPRRAHTYPGFEEVYEQAYSGDVAAIMELANHLIGDDNTAHGKQEALLWFRYASHLGNAEGSWRAYQLMQEMDGPENIEQLRTAELKAALVRRHIQALVHHARVIIESGNRPETQTAMSLLLQAGDHQEIQAIIDEMLIAGKGFIANEPLLQPHLERLAEADHHWPLYLLGSEYRKSIRTIEEHEERFDKIRDLWQRSHELGNVLASYELAILLYQRPVKDQLWAQAMKIMEHAASKGYRDAEYAYSIWLLEHHQKDRTMTEPILEQITNLLRSAAEKGNSQARLHFVDLIEEEVEEQMIAASTADLYYQAAVLQSPTAALHLGQWMIETSGCPELREPGLLWIEEAAQMGDEAGFLKMAAIYFEGKYVEIDKLRALRWLEAAAEAGNAEAQYSVALFYMRGEVVVRDARKAVRLLKMAAEQDHSQASIALATMDRIENSRVATNQDDAIEVFTTHGYASNHFHPVRLVMASGGVLREITEVRRGKPHAVQGGKRQGFDRAEPVFPLAAASFHPVRATITDLGYTAPFVVQEGVLLYTGKTQQIIVSIKPEQDLRNCYVAFLIENSNGGYDAWWQSAGTLRANRETKIFIPFESFEWRKKQISALLFSDGMEVATNRRLQPATLTAETANALQVERRQYLLSKAESLESTEATLLDPLDKVLLSRISESHELPAQIHLNAEGNISNIEFPSTLNTEDTIQLTRALLKTRWLPAVENGKPVPGSRLLKIGVF